jgi:hypothetical protein
MISSRKLDRNLTIARMHLNGMSYDDIGEKVGLSKTQIGTILHDDNIKAVINSTIRGMALAAPSIGNRLIDHCMQEDDPDRSVKAIGEYNKVVGIASPHASIYIQNMLVSGGVNLISPGLAGLIGSGSTQVVQDTEEIIDIDPD